jgi:hypothetical protein
MIRRGSTDGVTPVNTTLGRIFGISAAALAVTMFAFAAQAQKKDDTKKPPPKPPACSKIKKEEDCKARADCDWVVKGKKGSCKAKPKPKPEPKKK